MAFEQFRMQLLAQVDLRLGIVGGLAFVFHDLEPQVIERAAHLVELVLGLHHDFVKTLFDGPEFLLFGERAEVALPAPVAPRAANPGVQHASARKPHVLVETADEIRELRIRLVHGDFVRDLERHRHDGARIVGQRRVRHENQMRAALKAVHDFRSRLLARKLAEVFLDVLNLQRTLLERVLRNEIFHSDQPRCSIFAHVSRSDTVRLKTRPLDEESGSTQKYPSRSNCRRSGTRANATLGSALHSRSDSSEFGFKASMNVPPSTPRSGSGTENSRSYKRTSIGTA